MKQWIQKKYDVNLKLLSERYNISELFAEILVKRGLHSWDAVNEYLCPTLDRMHPPEKMKDMEKASAILRQKVGEGKKIGIIGDYDVDGIMSTAILYLGLKKIGADAVWKIPHRIRDGYGLRDYMAEEMAGRGVDTLVTCDNGISAADAVERAKRLGMTVIITDHHEVPLEGPARTEAVSAADAVVDPKQKDCPYPYKELCGSGVAYKLVETLWGRERDEGLQRQLLSFAAIATVCDVVPLTGENRIIVKNGLAVLQDTENTGLAALIRQLGFRWEISSRDLGFRIGPCLNASGRLGDASYGVELLLEREEEQAEQMAARLVQWNEERKAMTADAVEEAVEIIEREGYLENPVLCVNLNHCQESVAGIVAGRIREKYYRPVLILTSSGGKLKGSGRSIPGYHMQKALNACSELLLEYGGHAMAAGLSMETGNLGALQKKLNEDCELQESDFVEKIIFDREMPLGMVDERLLDELRLLQPVGEQNSGVLFAKRNVEICSVRIYGKENQIGRFQVMEEGEPYSLVDFDIHIHMKQGICERYSPAVWKELLSGTGSCLMDILYVPEYNKAYGGIQYRVVDCR